MTQRIYLDHAATTPMRPEAVAAVAKGMARWANPSSPHAEGRAARAALEDARARIKAALGWEGELIFTSGASEALAIGLGRAKGGRRFVSAVEHDAVFRAAPDAWVLPIDSDPDVNDVDRGAITRALADGDRPIIAIQHLNSETGIFQPLGEFARMIRAGGGILLADCAQSAGREPLPDADMIVVSAHKLGGPPGIGALLLRDLGLIEPGGGQEFGYRGGTENLPGALGFAAAVEAWVRDGKAWRGQMSDLSDEIVEVEEELDVPFFGVHCFHIRAIQMPHVSAATQLIRFDSMGFAVSAGSACASGSLKPSRVLAAFGVDPAVAANTIRVSFGWSTTAEEVRAFSKAWREIAEEAEARA